jgi:hypothetical protein
MVFAAIYSCKKDPIFEEIDYFEGNYRVDSVRVVTRTSSQVYKNQGEIILKKRPDKDTISAFGETEIVDTPDNENTFIFTQTLRSFNFTKVFSPSMLCLDVSGDKFVAWWFPDLNKQRITLFASCGNGRFRTVVTVTKQSERHFIWTYVESNDLGASDNLSSMTRRESIYLTKIN